MNNMVKLIMIIQVQTIADKFKQIATKWSQVKQI